MTSNERRLSEERITRWKDVANLEIPASIASVQNGGLVVCTYCQLPEIVLRDHAFVCADSDCPNSIPKSRPRFQGDDQIGIDPENPHCYCGVASRKLKTYNGNEVEECATLRCGFHGDGEKRKVKVVYPQRTSRLSASNRSSRATSGQTTPSSFNSLPRTDSAGSLYFKFERGLGNITPGNNTPRDSLSRSSSMTSFGTHFAQGLTMTSSKPDQKPDEEPEFNFPSAPPAQ